jgi:hypothetical protein
MRPTYGKFDATFRELASCFPIAFPVGKCDDHAFDKSGSEETDCVFGVRQNVRYPVFVEFGIFLMNFQTHTQDLKRPFSLPPVT